MCRITNTYQKIQEKQAVYKNFRVITMKGMHSPHGFKLLVSESLKTIFKVSLFGQLEIRLYALYCNVIVLCFAHKIRSLYTFNRIYWLKRLSILQGRYTNDL